MNMNWELCNKEGVELIRRRINAVSTLAGECFEYFGIHILDNDEYEISHMLVFPSYESVPFTKCCRKAPCFSYGDIRQLF